MVRFRTIAAVAALLFIAALITRRMMTTDETHIRRQFEKLAKTVSVQSDTSRTTLLVKSQTIQEIVANPCSLHVPSYNIDITFTPREIAREMLAIHSRVNHLDVAFFALVVDVLDDETATATATVKVSGAANNRVETGSDMMEIATRLEKSDGKWSFTLIEEVQVLRK